MKWKCEYCECVSDAVQASCPNGCPRESDGKAGTIEIIRNHKNWCKAKSGEGACDCGYKQFEERQ